MADTVTAGNDDEETLPRMMKSLNVMTKDDQQPREDFDEWCKDNKCTAKSNVQEKTVRKYLLCVVERIKEGFKNQPDLTAIANILKKNGDGQVASGQSSSGTPSKSGSSEAQSTPSSKIFLSRAAESKEWKAFSRWSNRNCFAEGIVKMYLLYIIADLRSYLEKRPAKDYLAKIESSLNK